MVHESYSVNMESYIIVVVGFDPRDHKVMHSTWRPESSEFNMAAQSTIYRYICTCPCSPCSAQAPLCGLLIPGIPLKHPVNSLLGSF